MDEEDLSCVICFENLSSCYLECSHSFCKECIFDWMKGSKSCPICRRDIIIAEPPSKIKEQKISDSSLKEKESNKGDNEKDKEGDKKGNSEGDKNLEGKCTAILKTGKSKGQCCRYKTWKKDHLWCKIHDPTLKEIRAKLRKIRKEEALKKAQQNIAIPNISALTLTPDREAKNIPSSGVVPQLADAKESVHLKVIPMEAPKSSKPKPKKRSANNFIPVYSPDCFMM